MQASPGTLVTLSLTYLDIDKGDTNVLPVECSKVRAPLKTPIPCEAGEVHLFEINMAKTGCLMTSYLVIDPSTGMPIPPPSGQDFWCTGGGFETCYVLDGPKPGVGKATQAGIGAGFIPTN